METLTLNNIQISDIIDIAKKAGTEILEVYNQKFDYELKEDKSPLTEADKRSHNLITSALKAKYPDIPILSEESKSVDYTTRKNWNPFWLVDPLDGTKEFIKKNGEFTVNIALIQDNKPILGVVYIPVYNITYYAIKGEGSYKQDKANTPLKLTGKTTIETDKLVIIGSRSHATQELMDFVEEKKKEFKEVEFISAGSSLKLCYIAEGKADIYPRLGPTMEWDTAAAQIVVEESGKTVKKYQSRDDLTYNKPNLLNDWFICE
jgi:3'(2'), 5'-bisphosphate nucleotidase